MGKAGRSEANMCQRFERKLCHNVYRLVSWCCLSVSGCSINSLLKQMLGARRAPLLQKERKFRYGSSGLSEAGVYHFAV